MHCCIILILTQLNEGIHLGGKENWKERTTTAVLSTNPLNKKRETGKDNGVPKRKIANQRQT